MLLVSVGSVEGAWITDQSWEFECGKTGFESLTRSTE